MERRQLEYFLAVVEHGGITRASRHLHVSQPAVSAALRKLESELGGNLFERVTGGLVLTAAGRALVEPAGQVLRDLDVAAQSVHDALGLQGGRLDIVAVPAVSSGWLPPVIAGFHRSHPRVAITVTSRIDGSEIAEEVRGGRQDIGLAVTEVNDLGLVVEHVGHQELQAVFPPGSPAGGEPIAFEDLLQRDLVTVGRGLSASRRWYEAEARRRGVPVPTPIELGSIDGVLPLVMQGVGYALWWTPTAEGVLGSCVLRPVRPFHRRPISVLMRAGPRPPATHAFLEQVKARRTAEA